MSRPSMYRDEYAEQGYKLALLGATDREIADFFEVSERTVNAWKRKYPEFLQSLKRGKQVADAKVAESLFKRACGYSHPDTHVSVIDGKVVMTELEKHYAPDTTACIFWLKNREPKRWRDKVEVKDDVNLNVFPPEEELDALYERAMAKAAERAKTLVGRRERLGIAVDRDDGE